MDAFDKFGMRASVLLNSDVCRKHPQIVEAGNERNWAWLAHRTSNSILHDGRGAALSLRLARTISDAAGHRPTGWMGRDSQRCEHALDIVPDKMLISGSRSTAMRLRRSTVGKITSKRP